MSCARHRVLIALSCGGGFPGVGFEFEEEVVAADAAAGGDGGKGTEVAGGTPGGEFGLAGGVLEVGGCAGDVGKIKAAEARMTSMTSIVVWICRLRLPSHSVWPPGATLAVPEIKRRRPCREEISMARLKELP